MRGAWEILQLLCPYGNWPHQRGMQVVDETAAVKMRENFLWSFARIFGGLPIYIGHPDDGGKRAEMRPVGRIERIFATPQGIAICARYSEEAFIKIANSELKSLSARWQMRDLGGGLFRPVRLISAGLTNNPNIPQSGAVLAPLSNAKKPLEKLKDAKASLRFLSKKIAACAKASGEISAHASRIKNENIDEGIARLGAKPAAFEIAAMAARQARETGCDYASSFAQIRRKYYGSNSLTRI